MNHLFGSKPSLNLEAGTGFEPVMLRAYETAVVTTLPAVRARRVRTLAITWHTP